MYHLPLISLISSTYNNGNKSLFESIFNQIYQPYGVTRPIRVNVYCKEVNEVLILYVECYQWSDR